jgi:very-short-patch-repair endonuclease
MLRWAELPADRVVHLGGTTLSDLGVTLSARPAEAPAVVIFEIDRELPLSDLIEAFLRRLELSALASYPAWLPEAAGITGTGGSGVRAVRSIALRAAAASGQHGPFLADLAVAALAEGSLEQRRLAPEIRASGLKRVIATAAEAPAMAIICQISDEFPPAAEPALVAAAEWLAEHAGAGVWLTGRPLTAVDRVVSMPMDEAPAPFQRTLFPAVAGSPHPASRAEQMLEAALLRCEWASGRAWNQTYQSGSLANPIRLDLVWAGEKCVVEIDGEEHRTAAHYAADRRRDVDLQLNGFAVLRFTNEQLYGDLWNVVSLIERYVRGSRSGTREGQCDVGEGPQRRPALGAAHTHGGG